MVTWMRHHNGCWLFAVATMALCGAVPSVMAAGQAATPTKLFNAISPVGTQHLLPAVAQAMSNGETFIGHADASALVDDDEQIQIDVSPGLWVTARKQRFETETDGTGVWYGEVERQRKLLKDTRHEVPVDALNSVVLVRRGHRVGGRVMVDGDVYMIMPDGHGQETVTRLDPEKRPPEAGPEGTDVEDMPAPSVPQARTARSAVSTHSIVRMMVVTTNQVRESGTDVDVLAALGIAVFNETNVNSHVDMTVENAGVMNVDYDEQPAIPGKSSFSVMLDSLAKGLGPLSAVSAFRKTHHADVVVMLVTDKSLCGLAKRNEKGAPPTDNMPFSVDEQACFAGEITSAHEVAHNFGAFHDLGQYGGVPQAIPYAHGLQHPSSIKDDSWRTGMAYACAKTEPSCPKLPNYSNPEVTYRGVPTGTAQFQDVARLMNERRDIVANFYSPPEGSLPPKAVARAKPTELASGTVELDGTASVTGVGGALHYAWMQVSGSPMLTIDHSDQAAATVAVPTIEQGGLFEFQLVVTNAVGLSDSQHVRLRVHPPSLSATITAPETVYSGQPVPVRATVVNPIGGTVKYTWSKTSQFAGSIGNNASGTYTAAEVGQAIRGNINLKVTVGSSEYTTPNKAVTVLPSTAPTGTISGPASLGAGEIGTFTVDATDPQGGALTYAWSTPVDWGGTVGNTATVTLTAPDVTQDSHATIAVRVTNDAGKTLDLSQPVTVTVPVAPITATLTVPSTVTVGASVPVRVDAQSATGKALSYSWHHTAAYFDGDIGNSPTGTYTAKAAGEGQTGEIYVNISDGIHTYTTPAQAVAILADSGGVAPCHEPWSASKVYGVITPTSPPAYVSQSGHNYEQQFWTQGDDPEQRNGMGQPWKNLGPCK
ncbi:hypothetical protein DWU98_14875 [Dyella monticola]|uniref:Uncharacterized protein n=1 Tax=Dyella monticola TaxID=1927958 RepID=A0A370WVS4_9GAMM|nr:M12 family metallo-peptidase [Dyella monticola]RDS80190.1 hypothetical protein DWU98_14875 [Dyella monticola]